jgi:uncharacterized membrane protein (UPF0127 family)
MSNSGRHKLAPPADLCMRYSLQRLEVAQGWWGRACGLLGRAELPIGHGLWMAPCSAIHTLGMRFPIDVVFLDAQGRVVRHYRQVPPHRLMIRGGPGAVSVLELPAGALERIPGAG